MAQTVKIEAKNRDQVGSRANKRLRDSGMLPGVVYGHKEAVVPVTLPKKELVKHIEKGTHLFELSIAGKNETVLVKEVQYNHLGNEVIHIDFARVDLNERVTVTVPVELKGTPKGEDDGGILTQVLTDLEVECLVTDIPDVIRHNISELKLNQSLHIRELVAPKGVKFVLDGEVIVANCRAIVEQAAAVVEGVEGGAEPEVIGRKKEDEAAAEDAKDAKK